MLTPLTSLARPSPFPPPPPPFFLPFLPSTWCPRGLSAPTSVSRQFRLNFTSISRGGRSTANADFSKAPLWIKWRALLNAIFCVRFFLRVSLPVFSVSISAPVLPFLLIDSPFFYLPALQILSPHYFPFPKKFFLVFSLKNRRSFLRLYRMLNPLRQ